MKKHKGYTLIENISTYKLMPGDIVCSKQYPFIDNPYIEIIPRDAKRYTIEDLIAIHGIKECVGYAKTHCDEETEWVRLHEYDIIPIDAIWITDGYDFPPDDELDDHKLGDEFPGIGKTVNWTTFSGYLFKGTSVYAPKNSLAPARPRKLPMNPIFSKPLPLP
jgi:hypothetical protein